MSQLAPRTFARRRLALGVSAIALLATPALAQTEAQAERPASAPAEAQAEPAAAAQKAAPAETHVDEDGYEVDAFVVTAAAQQRGSVVGDIPPEIQLSPRDIRAYGVSNVSELITALAPQTSSGRGDGRPIILINGQRISSFVEVRDLPTEAIARVDILPEEVSLKYGYRADQRVINMVLRQRFRATTVEAGYKTPTQGDGEVADGKLTRFRILNDQRLLLDGKVSTTRPVLESDRNIANTTNDAAYRSLQGESESVTLTAVMNRPIREGIAGGLNASLDASRNESLLGLPQGTNLNPVDPFALSDPDALKRVTDAVAGHLGGTANGAINGWNWSVTANADYSDTQSTTDRSVGGVAFTDKSRSKSTTADTELVVNGRLAELAAGSVSTTVKVGGSLSRLDSRSLRSGIVREGDLARDIGSFQANMDVPLTSRSRDVRAAFGDLSANVNVAVDELSDFGTLTSFGYGLNWSPIKPLRLIASVTEEENAPTVQQLGSPEQATQGVRVFDFRTGQTVEVTRIEGGSTNLDADSRTVIKLGLNLKPFDKTDLTFSADYVKTRIEDVIATFPTATNEIEAAFPERFIRDASGRLLQIDSRAVNFDRRDTEQLRWGFTYRRPLGPQRPQGGVPNRAPQPARTADGATPAPAAGATPGASQNAQANPASPPGMSELRPPEGRFGPGGPPGAGPGGPGGGRGFGPGGPGGRFGGGPPGGGNFQIGIYHTVKLQDEVLIRPGVAKLDLLNGSALGNGGGTARHQVDLQANASRNGLGVAMNAKWQSASHVDGGATGSLRFDDLTTINVRLFADLGAQPIVRQKYPWLRGARVSIGIDNLFDARQQVTAANGATPVNFQPDYLDPLGRQVRISFRKLFF